MGDGNLLYYGARERARSFTRFATRSFHAGIDEQFERGREREGLFLLLYRFLIFHDSLYIYRTSKVIVLYVTAIIYEP